MTTFIGETFNDTDPAVHTGESPEDRRRYLQLLADLALAAADHEHWQRHIEEQPVVGC